MNRIRCGRVAGVLLVAAMLGLSGCGSRWAVEWGGGGCHSGYSGHGHGDGAAGLIILGALAVAWGIHEIVEACR